MITLSELEVVFPRLGCDEVGKGDFFGPLVACGVVVTEKNYRFFEGVNDSKKLSDKRIAALAPDLMGKVPHSVVKIGPSRYNELYERFGNINAILGWAHSRVIRNLLEQGQAPQAVVIDQFGPEFRVLGNLRDVDFDLKRIHFFHRAEADLAVAAASVIARHVFLLEMESLGKKLGAKIPLGAGAPVDQAAREIHRKHGGGIFKEFAKLHFKNFSRLV